MSSYKENTPTADVLMNSMRAMGYSFEAAIADIIDNSISAHATEIILDFPIDPSTCYIAVLDNGCGMSKDQLYDAMKYGSERKQHVRDEEDLGRFGLGLKSASLSQCRKLTVLSKKDDVISGYIWNLDVIEKYKNWLMLDCSDEDIKKVPQVKYLDHKKSGTVVLWENFDLIEKSNGNVYSTLNNLKESTSNYIALIYHRYLSGELGNKLSIRINNYEIKPFDPFLENHKKTNIRRRIEMPIMDSNGIERMVIVQAYILPFQKDLSSSDKKLSGGIENYRTKQGFYIYRNFRLIVWGTWFNRHRDELTKYARIKVDIPNSLDDIWGIDIKKQNAKIPAVIRQRLTKAVDEAMDIAVKAQTYRGRIAKVDDNIDYIWDRISERNDQYSYVINRNSRIFDLIKRQVDDETWESFDMVLEEIENSIPYQQIYIDKSQNKVLEETDSERLADIENKGRILIDLAVKLGNSGKKDIIDKLFLSEPFSKYPQIKEKYLEELI